MCHGELSVVKGQGKVTEEKLSASLCIVSHFSHWLTLQTNIKKNIFNLPIIFFSGITFKAMGVMFLYQVRG